MYVTSNHGKDQFKLKKFETLKSAQPPETSMLQPNHLYTTEGYKQGYMYPLAGYCYHFTCLASNNFEFILQFIFIFKSLILNAYFHSCMAFTRLTAMQNFLTFILFQLYH